MKNKKGFTLVELLVVIAIIGILSTVAVINLNVARRDAKLATAQASMRSVLPAIADCFINDEHLTDGSGARCIPPNTVWVPGTPICNGSSVTWPEMPDDVTPTSCWSLDTETFNFYFIAELTALQYVRCDKDGCQIIIN